MARGWSGDRVAPRAGQCICMRLILATEFHFHSSIGSSSGSSDIQRRQRRHPLCSKPASLSVALTRHLRAFVKFSANRRQARTQARQFDEPPHTHTTPHIQWRCACTNDIIMVHQRKFPMQLTADKLWAQWLITCVTHACGMLIGCNAGGLVSKVA